MTNTRTAVLCSALALLCPTARAGADEPAPSAKPAAQTDLGGAASDRPWARAVSPAEQKAAGELFREGNGLLKESLFVAAAEKYREALRHWDHPGIHYNLALALLNLDQPVEVFGQLEEAMKFGAAPLDTDKFEHAGRYKALIEKQLARVEITCSQPGAVVTLDGRTLYTATLYTAPGRSEALVRVGQHTLVATRTGFVTTQKTPTLLAGKKTTIELKLYTAEDLTQYKRRWHNALPWSVVGAGVLVAAIGGILHWQASESFKSYDRGVSSCGSGNPSGGCTPDGALAAKKILGENLQATAISFYTIGGAAVVAGAVLVYVNRARPFHINPERDRLTLLPVAGPSGGGLLAQVRF
jgi:hypothetical protein